MAFWVSFPDRRVAPVGNTFIDLGFEDLFGQTDHGSGILRLKRSRSYAGYLPHDLVMLHAASRGPQTPSSPNSNSKTTKDSYVDEDRDANGSDSPGQSSVHTPGRQARSPTSTEPVPAQGVITTLMIRGLPRNLTQRELLKELDGSGFGGLYDFCYLPRSMASAENQGFAFVNFTSVAAAGLFIGSWHRRRRCGLSVREAALNISPASLQGLEQNVAMWQKTRLRRIRNPEYRPFVCSDVPDL